MQIVIVFPNVTWNRVKQLLEQEENGFVQWEVIWTLDRCS